jgi:DNA-binding MarR family transcriptional regulator
MAPAGRRSKTSARSAEQPALAGGAAAAGEPEDSVEAHVESAVAYWPQIDPEVESIVIRLNRADRYLIKAATVSLDRVGLTYEEFKVLILLHDGPRSHGSLCRELLVSSGVMTNRLDKLERAELLLRKPDPGDRRGVLLELTQGGRQRLDEYIDLGAKRERELLEVLSPSEKHALNELLRKLIGGLQSELGPAPRTLRAATEAP